MGDVVVHSPASAGSRGQNQVSRQSRQSSPTKVTFPNSRQSSARGDTAMSGEESAPNRNPFKMPQDNDIFMLRDKERQRKKEERKRQRDLRVHEKTTYATRVNFKTASMIRPAESEDDQDKSDEDDGKSVAVKDDPQFTLAVTRDRHVEKESLADYINKKREMFLVQYSLGVKRDEMRKLEEIAAAEETKLEMAERYLEEDAAMFDEFLKENDKNSVEAIKIAEAETKAKLEKVAEIKKIHAQMMAIKSEISKYEDTLKEYQLYKEFLDNLCPAEWLDERQVLRLQRKQERQRERQRTADSRRTGTPVGSEKSLGTIKSGSKKAGMTNKRPKGSGTKTKDESLTNSQIQQQSEDEESDEELELYFTDPQQLLDLFAELEENNLSLIQNSQETEEALEEQKQNIKNTRRKMEKETDVLRDQIDKLNSAIMREEEKAKDLEIKARMFSYGEFQADDQEKMLARLNRKVEDVYRSCIGDNEASIGTLQMLTNIENRLEELFEQIELMPQDKVEMAEKAKEKERRLKLREEKMEQQKQHQEERVRRALERAKADPKKQTGRKLVGRSEPPRLARKHDDGADQATREEEELAYYFT